jgi:hypothetical protein
VLLHEGDRSSTARTGTEWISVPSTMRLLSLPLNRPGTRRGTIRSLIRFAKRSSQIQRLAYAADMPAPVLNAEEQCPAGGGRARKALPRRLTELVPEAGSGKAR